MTASHPLVGVVLGSASDAPYAQTLSQTLASFGISHEVTITSAHRTPDDTVRYARNASSRGIQVLVCAAGLSAALPGVVAANTTLPVIGVPVPAGTLGGIDALLSIAQMPPGVPVASVGIDGAKNAALLAVRILALQDEALGRKLNEWAEAESSRILTAREAIEGMPAAPGEAYRS